MALLAQPFAYSDGEMSFVETDFFPGSKDSPGYRGI
jgi:hypothetical protein